MHSIFREKKSGTVARAPKQLAYKNIFVHGIPLTLHSFLEGEIKLHWEAIFISKTGKCPSNSFDICNPERNRRQIQKTEWAPALSFLLQGLVSKDAMGKQHPWEQHCPGSGRRQGPCYTGTEKCWGCCLAKKATAKGRWPEPREAQRCVQLLRGAAPQRAQQKLLAKSCSF